MRKIVLSSLFALVLLAACSEDSSDKPKAVTETSSGIVRRSIPKDADVRPPTEAPARKQSQFIYAKTTCNIRRGPGTRYSIARKAMKGEKLEYISLEGNWYKLKVGKGRPQEWVHKSVVTPMEKSRP
jgi:uncharacterized protein YgiM (DUF1202 family)